jgi:hypothetical protein
MPANPAGYFNNDPPPDRFSPEFLRAKQRANAAMLAAMRAAHDRPIDVFAPRSNSGMDQVGGTPPLGGFNDRDISDQADALASRVTPSNLQQTERADVTPFRKVTPPRPSRPDPTPPLRPAATMHPWNAAIAAFESIDRSQCRGPAPMTKADLGELLKSALRGGR